MSQLFALDLHGRTVLVAGAGTVATRRVRRLLAEGARVVVVAPDASDDIARLASHGDLTWHRRAVQSGDLDDAWLTVAATDNAAANAQVAQWSEARRILCADASAAARGTARFAASSRHGDLVIGVASTASPDPARVRAVRDALAAHVDAGGVDLRRRRRGTGRVILVGSGPGDPGMMTVRGRQALAEADVVVTDRLGATSVVATLPDDVEVINVGKSPDNHPVPQHEINDVLVERALAGHTVVRLKGGDPFVFGRGGEEVHACTAAGVDVEVVPGVTSALAVPALAGIPATQRGVADSVLITTGHGGATAAALNAMLEGATVVMLMAVSALPEIVTAALDAGIDPDTPVAIVERGSTPDERTTHARISDIIRIAEETAVKPPAVIVVGKVAAAGLLASTVAATPTPEEARGDARG